MTRTLFLHSKVQDPYTGYEEMLAGNPVYWDEANGLWAIYSYETCKSLLHNEHAQIPVINKDALNEHALLISNHLVRLSNGIEHAITRLVAMRLYEKMKIIAIDKLVEKLLGVNHAARETDWVETIGKKLPLLTVLKSLDFTDKDAAMICANIQKLVKIMLPNKTPEQVNEINTISKDIYRLVESHLLSSHLFEAVIHNKSEQYKIEADKMLVLWVCNCIGLMIQSYDAGRGILSNALLQALNNPVQSATKDLLYKSVTETLRYDPPVHNTRRVAANDITLNQVTVKKGDALLLVLAAANRDPLQFNQPNRYDIKRPNNNEHLTFGSGAHNCIASHFAVNLAVESLYYLFNRYTNVRLIEHAITYEPLANVRLPKSMLMYFS